MNILTTHGINQWNEDWELGELNTTTGAEVSSASRIRTKGYVKVAPNTSYFCYSKDGKSIWCLFYDSTKSVIEGWSTGGAVSENASRISQWIFQTPPNCAYIRFYIVSSTTYDKNSSINYPSTITSYQPYESKIILHSGKAVLVQ